MGIYQFDPDPHFQFFCEHGAWSSTHLVLLSMDLSLSIGELHCFVAILLKADHRAVSKDALLGAVGEDVLDGLVWECYLLCAIWVELLCLLTTLMRKVKENFILAYSIRKWIIRLNLSEFS